MLQSEPKLRGLQYIGADMHLAVREHRTAGMRLHSHDYFEMEILVEGEGWMEMNSRRYELTAGCIYFLTPADFHEVTLSQGSRLWNISFDGSLFESLRAERLFACNNSFRRVAAEVLQRLDAAARLLAEEGDPLRQRLLVEYLLRAAEIWQDTEASVPPIRRAVLYVETFFREDPTLSEVAARVGLSPSYFGERFRRETGESYVAYLNRCKVNCAVMLLKNGKSVTEACFESGFGSLSGFRYAFRQRMGTSPKEYAHR